MYHLMLARKPYLVLTMVTDMDMVIQVQILDEVDCISHSTNTLGKGMNPVILLPVMSK